MNNSEISLLVKRMGKKSLDDNARSTIQGKFIRLEDGYTHYEISGEGETIVLVHGYATPYFIYDKIYAFFTNKGYKVIRYDLYGRGYSDRVKTDYTPDFFAKQLKELTDALCPDEKFYLVGTSMGGSICATFVSKYSERVKKLILLAPAGMDTFKPPFYMKLCKIKGLGEIVFYSIAGKILLRKCASELYYGSKDEKDYYYRSFASATEYKGFLRCTLSSLRNTILKTDQTVDSYRKVARIGTPTLCIWGTKDKTMPYYQSERLKEICPKAKLITYDGSGHIFLFDEGDRTNSDIYEFIKE